MAEQMHLRNSLFGTFRIRMPFSRNASLLVGLVIIIVTIAIAVLAPVIAPHDPYAQAIANRRVPPIWHGWLYESPRATWVHPLGTDNLGRDFLSRLIYGSQVSLLVAFAVTLISGIIGISMGVIAGYLGGAADRIVNFVLGVRLSLPGILVVLAVAALVGSSLTSLILLLGLLHWDRFCVVSRTLAREQSAREYVEAARISGCSELWILTREMLPNMVGPLIVVATISMANAVLLEAALSFLGLGTQPPTASWGLMLAEAKNDMFFNPWMITLPGTLIFILVLSFNLLGDGLRDWLTVEGRA